MMIILFFCIITFALKAHAAEPFNFLQLPVELQRTVAGNIFKLHDFHTIDEQMATFSSLKVTCKHIFAQTDINNQECSEVISKNRIQSKVIKTCLSKKFDETFIHEHFYDKKILEEYLVPEYNILSWRTIRSYSSETLAALAAFQELQKITLRSQSNWLKHKMNLIAEKIFDTKNGKTIIPMKIINTIAHFNGKVCLLQKCPTTRQDQYGDIHLFKISPEYNIADSVDTIEKNTHFCPILAKYTNTGQLFYVLNVIRPDYAAQSFAYVRDYTNFDRKNDNFEQAFHFDEQFSLASADLYKNFKIKAAEILGDGSVILLTSHYSNASATRTLHLKIRKLDSSRVKNDEQFRQVNIPDRIDQEIEKNFIFTIKKNEFLIGSLPDYNIVYQKPLVKKSKTAPSEHDALVNK